MKYRYSNYIFFVLSIVLSTTDVAIAQANMGQIRSIDKAWEELGLDSKHHVGISVYDLQKKKTIFNHREDNSFTPASNVKILTMYAALELLDEQLDAALYIEKEDSLIIWGGGDPGTYFPDREQPAALPDFIRASNKKIIFCDDHFQTTRFGTGWAWDDYHFTYQCERNAFPIYGNRLWILRSGDDITVTPAYLTSLLKVSTDSVSDEGKTEWGDGYFYTYNPIESIEEVEVPVTFFKNDVQYSWAEATGKEILFTHKPLPPDALHIKGSSRDTLIRIMMQESDNFIAEQLLLACALKELGHMSEKDIIDSLLYGPLSDIESEIDWVDGSGLSRYNLMTPRSIISLMLHILELKDISYLKEMFPAGGKTGTLQYSFKGPKGIPYIYAKSGSLKNIYCLSGFVLTKSGNILLFSWMNNQIPGKSYELQKTMEKFFSFLYEQY